MGTDEETGDDAEKRALERLRRASDRDSLGRFAKGNRLGPGRPKGSGKKASLDRELRRLVAEADRDPDQMHPAQVLLDLAIGAQQPQSPLQVMALRMLFERVDGRPRQAVEREEEDPRAWSIIVPELPEPSQDASADADASDAAELAEIALASSEEAQGPRNVESVTVAPAEPAETSDFDDSDDSDDFMQL